MPPPAFAAVSGSSNSNTRRTALIALAAASVAATAVFACYALADMQRTGALHARRLLGRANHRSLPPAAQRAAALLARTDGARHLLAGWPAPGVKDAEKAALVTKAAEKVANATSAAAGTAADELEAQRLALLSAPVAARRDNNSIPAPLPGLPPHQDPYAWLRDDNRTNEAVLSHLRAENEYTRAALADTEALQRELYREMRSRIREEDSTVPTRLNGYWRYSYTKTGDQYKTHVRVKVPTAADGKAAAAGPAPDENDAPPASLPVEVLLDENKRRATVGSEFYQMSGLTVSPDNKLVAWSEDTEGGEKYTVVVAEAGTGRVLAELAGRPPVRGTSGELAWAADSRTLFYVVKDDMDRPYKVLRRKYALGKEEEAALERELKDEAAAAKKNSKDAAKAAADDDDDTNGDALVFVDPDEAYYVGIEVSASGQYLLIKSGSAITSETLVLRRAEPAAAPRVFLPRTEDVEYGLDHHSGFAGLSGKEADAAAAAAAGNGTKGSGGWWVYTYRDADRPNSELRAAPAGAEAREGALTAAAPAATAAPRRRAKSRPPPSARRPPAARSSCSSRTAPTSSSRALTCPAATWPSLSARAATSAPSCTSSCRRPTRPRDLPLPLLPPPRLLQSPPRTPPYPCRRPRPWPRAGASSPLTSRPTRCRGIWRATLTRPCCAWPTSRCARPRPSSTSTSPRASAPSARCSPCSTTSTRPTT